MSCLSWNCLCSRSTSLSCSERRFVVRGAAVHQAAVWLTLASRSVGAQFVCLLWKAHFYAPILQPSWQQKKKRSLLWKRLNQSWVVGFFLHPKGFTSSMTSSNLVNHTMIYCCLTCSSYDSKSWNNLDKTKQNRIKRGEIESDALLTWLPHISGRYYQVPFRH